MLNLVQHLAFISEGDPETILKQVQDKVQDDTLQKYSNVFG
jgi:hypothetical protein